MLSSGAKKILGFVAAGVVLSGCVEVLTDQEGATKLLLEEGYTPLEVGGYAPFYGFKHESQKTKFRAINAEGDTITGAVTDGPFTDPVIRKSLFY